jgi:hypothetical protein
MAIVANGQTYPSICESDFNNFVQNADIIDENLKFVDLQISFVATNVLKDFNVE